MNDKNDFIEEDDQECVDFISEHLPEEYRTKITDEKIYYVLDLIYSYFYENNLVDEDNDTIQEANIAEEDMLNFIMAAVKKEKIVELTEDEVETILDGEYEYGKTKGIYVE
ncbi:MAG: hypothetical protein ACI3Z7_04735 [Candidatus Aphodosoma sp.]